MLGLEENMSESNVVDLRPDRFLRAMRESGDFAGAAECAGFTVPDAEELCRDTPKFDLAVIECHLEFLEEQLEAQKQEKLRKLREAHMVGYRARHRA